MEYLYGDVVARLTLRRYKIHAAVFLEILDERPGVNHLAWMPISSGLCKTLAMLLDAFLFPKYKQF